MKRRAVFHPINPHATCIDDAGSSVCYVVCGTERAAVIDTVNGWENLYEIVREITDLPLVVINTHGHCDHVWGNTFFKEAFIHPADMETHDRHFASKAGTSPDRAAQMGVTDEELQAFIQAPPCPLKPIRGGDTIDLGGRVLEVIEIPGHTQGSIALLDREDGILYTGDAINGQAWLQLPESSCLSDYLETLDALDAWRPFFTELRNGHNTYGIPASYIDEVHSSVREILETHGENDDDYQWFGGTCRRHMINEENFLLYTSDKLK